VRHAIVFFLFFSLLFLLSCAGEKSAVAEADMVSDAATDAVSDAATDTVSTQDETADTVDDLLPEADLLDSDDSAVPDDDILLTCDDLWMGGAVLVVTSKDTSIDCMVDKDRDKVTELDGSHCGRAVVTCGWRGNVYPFCELTEVSWGQLPTGEPAYSRVELYRSNMQGGWPLWGVWWRTGDPEEVFVGAEEQCQIIHSIYVVGYRLVFTP